MEEFAPNPASTLVEHVAQTADNLAGRIKKFEEELEQAERQVQYDLSNQRNDRLGERSRA